MDIKERLSFFQEMVQCEYPLHLWHYSPEFELIETDCPAELMLPDIISMLGFSSLVLAHIESGNRMPLILDTEFGLLWIAGFEYQGFALQQIHIVGPAFTGSNSHLVLRKKLDSYQLTVKLRSKIVKQIESVPIIPSSVLLSYAIMFHCAITGERITAVSAPLLYNGELVGIMRYVTSMRLVDRQVLVMTLVAVILSVSILILVYISNIYFVRSIVDPVKNITGIARRIAGGSYGIQVEKKFDDEVGDLTDAINDMSLRIKQAESMKSEFISSVSHELRTPLTAITGWAETIMSGEARDEGDVRKGMGIIASEARRLSGMVEELLDFSRLQSGRLKLNPTKLDLVAELSDAVLMFTERARQENIQLNYDEPMDILPIMGDANRLRQVFVNILDNALKYSDAGDSITVLVQVADNKATILIQDTGIGIAPEDLPKIKTRFYKANATRRGSGIGLAVADEIVSMHNGTLTLDSKEGVGTTVSITLPLFVS